MSATTIQVNKDYFTLEKTNEFIRDHEAACQTMEIDLFAQLFLKYDLSFIDEYSDVLTAIAETITDWKMEILETQLQKVSTFDSNCIFCSIGKKVKVYKWSYIHTNAIQPANKVVRYSQIAFMFDIQDGRLVNYGTCNAYLQQDEIGNL